MNDNTMNNMKRLAGGSVVENNSADSSIFTRTFAYIDGFNLYYGVNSLQNKKLKWSNLIKLMQCFLHEQNDKLIATKFFTSEPIFITHDNGQKLLRHKNYVNIQKSLGVDVVDGKFKRKYIKCKNCIDNNTGLSCLNCNYTKIYEHEEKQTDVNLATSIIADYFLHKPNKILICSADSDFVPVIKLFTQIKADITIKFIIPPNAGNFAEIKDALSLFYQSKNRANHQIGIVKMNEVHLHKAQMKDKIDIDGNIITNPYL